MRRSSVAVFAAASVVLSMMFAAGVSASVPREPVPFTKNNPLTLSSPESNYWVYVPDSYDESHATPTKLFVWLHGCGGFASGDIWTVSPGGNQQDWISVTVGGREGGCWNMDADPAKVLAAVASVETHFNIDARRVILGGYSSGGELAYRTAFYNAGSFAGVLATNTSPFRDTGSSQTSSLAAATWKFNVVHLVHLQDDVYPIAGVQAETDAMISSGFPLTRVDVEGTHYDGAGDIVNMHPVPGTSADIRTYLLPHIDDGWLSPEPELGPPDPGPGATLGIKLAGKPGKVTRSRSATFRFISSVAGSSFECRIDSKPFSRCQSPKSFSALSKGSHKFRVRASTAGVSGPVVRYGWKIKRHRHLNRH